MIIFIAATGFVAFLGYTSICRRPIVFKKLIAFRVCQAILSLLWLIWSIIRAGPFDGWSRISALAGAMPSGAAGFCIFMTILQSIGYMGSCGIGIFCLIKAGSASEEGLEKRYAETSDNNRT